MQCMRVHQGGWVLAAAVHACASSSTICVSKALDFALASLQAKECSKASHSRAANKEQTPY